MDYLIYWLLIGSLSLNYLYLKRHREQSRIKYSWFAYAKGLLMGLVLGPLSIPVSSLIDWWMGD